MDVEGSGMCCLHNQGKSALRWWIQQVTVRHQYTSTALHGSNSEILTVKSCLVFLFLSLSFVPMVRFLLVLTFTSCALFQWCMYKFQLVFHFSLLIQGAVREMTCFDMDCTRPVGEIEGWGWWPSALNVMPFSCHHAFVVAWSPRVRLRHVCNDGRVYR